LTLTIHRAMRGAVVVAVALILSACATSRMRHAAQLAESEQDWDRAVVEYTKMVRADPEDRNARASLEQAKLRAAQGHFATARRLASIGRFDDALVEYTVAAELNPTNGTIHPVRPSSRRSSPRAWKRRFPARPCPRMSCCRTR
jgi:tetratricopeptide (TPR) repeat protein